MTGAYERELRDVLAGVSRGVEKVIKTCTPEERERMRSVVQRPFLVVRAAGSGMEGSGDLVALRGDCSFPIEVKTRKGKKLYLAGRTKDQLAAMIREAERSELMPLYAYRLKGVRGDSWRIFRVETNNLRGVLKALAQRIPSLPRTRTGSLFIDWDQGMPLNEFIALMCSKPKSDDRVVNSLKARVPSEPSSPVVKDSELDVWAELKARKSSESSLLQR
ncbi:MAG: Holliday junction resolvase [Candidatus Poseidoniales archaeon]|nr:MAG: Holliday junction resolvase [Candidatus Poseidoniales archaeon]